MIYQQIQHSALHEELSPARHDAFSCSTSQGEVQKAVKGQARQSKCNLALPSVLTLLSNLGFITTHSQMCSETKFYNLFKQYFYSCFKNQFKPVLLRKNVITLFTPCKQSKIVRLYVVFPNEASL